MKTKRLSVILPCAFIVLIPVIAAELVIRNLGGIIGAVLSSESGGTYDFARIFAQTADASVIPHALLPLAFGALFAAACFCVFPRIKSRALLVFSRIFLFFSFLLTGFACSILLAQVNGIRFCDLLAELLPLIDKL